MSYIQDSLINDEKIIFETKSHKVLLYISWISIIAGIISIVTFIDWNNLNVFGVSEKIVSNSQSQFKALIFGFILIAIGIHRRILYSTSEFGVTNKRVLAKFGFFQRVMVDLSIKNLQSIVVDQAIGGRIFNYGTIKVMGMGANEIIPFIPEPLKLRKIIQEQMEISHSSTSLNN
jgi:hypothetical protein